MKRIEKQIDIAANTILDFKGSYKNLLIYSNVDYEIQVMDYTFEFQPQHSLYELSSCELYVIIKGE